MKSIGMKDKCIQGDNIEKFWNCTTVGPRILDIWLLYILHFHMLQILTPNPYFIYQIRTFVHRWQKKHFKLSQCGAIQLSPELCFVPTKCQKGWWQCLLGLRTGSAAPCLLRLRVQILPRTWMSTSCECCVLSDRGLCNRPITCPQESYRLWCV
jgi:hypothetical protein